MKLIWPSSRCHPRQIVFQFVSTIVIPLIKSGMHSHIRINCEDNHMRISDKNDIYIHFSCPNGSVQERQQETSVLQKLLQ